MRKIKKKFKRPRAPWNLAQIKEDRVLLKEYGLRRKKEIWKAQAILREFRQRARNLAAAKNKQEEKVLLDRLRRLGIIKKHDATLDDVLGLTIRDVLSRRLQTIVFASGMASTPREARQMIIHGCVKVAGRRSSFPSFLVPAELEAGIEVRQPARAAEPAVQPETAMQPEKEEASNEQ